MLSNHCHNAYHSIKTCCWNWNLSFNDQSFVYQWLVWISCQVNNYFKHKAVNLASIYCGKKELLQVWKKGVSKRDSFHILCGKPSKMHMFQLFRIMHYELHGDKGYYNSFLNALHRSLINKRTEKAKELAVNSNAL